MWGRVPASHRPDEVAGGQRKLHWVECKSFEMRLTCIAGHTGKGWGGLQTLSAHPDLSLSVAGAGNMVNMGMMIAPMIMLFVQQADLDWFSLSLPLYLSHTRKHTHTHLRKH